MKESWIKFCILPEHFWSFTAKQRCGIILNNSSRWVKKKNNNMAPCLFSLVLSSAVEVEAQKSQVVLKPLPVAAKPNCATLPKDKWAWQHSTGVNSIFWIQFGISEGVQFVVLFCFRSPRLHQMFMRFPPSYSVGEALGMFRGLQSFTWCTDLRGSRWSKFFFFSSLGWTVPFKPFSQLHRKSDARSPSTS